MATRLKLHPVFDKVNRPLSDTAIAYDGLAAVYRQRGEHDTNGLFEFAGARSYTDRALWARLDAMLVRLWTGGRRAIRILDLGCGAGSWLLRLAVRARDLGFSAIDGLGVDISPAMIDIARSHLRYAFDPHIGLRFEVADMLESMDAEDEGSFDIVICLGVLNHLTADQRAHAGAGIERVCDGEIFVTTPSVGGNLSVDLAEAFDVRQLHQDNGADRLEIHLQDGRRLDLPSHLFSAGELLTMFSDHVERRELLGLDLFHGRFHDDPRWNPCGLDHRDRDEELERLEHLCEAMPAMLDSAAQIFFHGRTMEGPAHFVSREG
jgi:SAM-dependent methyltransferase